MQFATGQQRWARFVDAIKNKWDYFQKQNDRDNRYIEVSWEIKLIPIRILLLK